MLCICKLQWGWRYNLAVKSSESSCRGPEVKSKHPHGNLEPYKMLILGDPIPSSDFYVNYTNILYTK